MIIMLVWRIWYLRNDIVHGKEILPPKATVDYLQSYMNSLPHARLYSTKDIIKGKFSLMDDRLVVVRWTEAISPWPPPPAYHVAFLVDGSFLAEDGAAAMGMILRRSNGSVIFAAYRFLFNCNDALEVEIRAPMQGMALALQHTDDPIIFPVRFFRGFGNSLGRVCHVRLTVTWSLRLSS